MEIVRIFDKKDTFWCPCYPEDKGDDIFTVLLTQWTDTQYLMNFFKDNQKDLQNKYWHGINIDTAVELVMAEAYYLQEKLICIEYAEPGCINVKISDIFKPYKKHQYVINQIDEDYFVKGKLDSLPQMLRLYGVELSDGTIIISGGAIKITGGGLIRTHLKVEKERLYKLFDYLSVNNITNIEALK